MAVRFVLKQGSTGRFRFNLVATHGQVIATSEAYESKASAIKGIESALDSPDACIGLALPGRRSAEGRSRHRRPPPRALEPPWVAPQRHTTNGSDG
jgi:uncharacterized protein